MRQNSYSEGNWFYNKIRYCVFGVKCATKSYNNSLIGYINGNIVTRVEVTTVPLLMQNHLFMLSVKLINRTK